jgi:hypothetical protein
MSAGLCRFGKSFFYDVLTNSKSHQPFKDKDPRPAALASDAVHFRNATSQEPTKGTSSRGCRKEDGLSNVLALVRSG